MIPVEVGTVWEHPVKVTEKPWHKWFAWRPIKSNGKIIWLKSIYRMSWQADWGDMRIHPKIRHWEYAETEFDLLKRKE